MATIQAARLHAVLKHRFAYLRTLIMSLRDVPIDNSKLEGLPEGHSPIIMAVDKNWRLYYDPKLLEPLSVEVAATMLVHSALHCALGHSERYESVTKTVSPEMWHLAADLAIWSLIDATTSGMLGAIMKQFPSTPTAERLGFPTGQTAEEYLRLIIENSQQVQTFVKGALTDACDGSCADGIGRPWELPDSNSEDDMSLRRRRAGIIREIAETIKNSARMAGTGHGELERLVNMYFPPRNRVADLIKTLRCAVSDIAAGDDYYTWKLPSRRYPKADVIMPRTLSYKPDIRVIVDSSLSMDDEDFAIALGEIVGICRRLGSSVRVYSGDTELGACDVASRRRRPKIVGGGGTDMGAVMAQVIARERLQHKRVILVVITDGYTPWDYQPPANVTPIVVLTKRTKPPVWAKHVVRYTDDTL